MPRSANLRYQEALDFAIRVGQKENAVSVCPRSFDRAVLSWQLNGTTRMYYSPRL